MTSFIAPALPAGRRALLRSRQRLAVAWASCRARLLGRHAIRREQGAEAAAAREQAAAVLRGDPIPGEPAGKGCGRGRRGGTASAASLPALAPISWAPQMREALLAALHSLSNNRLRALLTTVGIVVGIAAVIVLVALGNGMKTNFNTKFSRLANQITITAAKGAVADGGQPRNLTDQDVAALRDPRRAPHITEVSPAMQGTVTVTAGQAKDKATLFGATENFLDLMDFHLAAGRWFTVSQMNRGERGAVIGQQALNLLWPNTDPNQIIGRPVRLGHSTFKVQGVLTANGQQDNAVIVPFDAARAYLVGNENGKVDLIIVKSTSVDTVSQAAAEVVKVLDKQHFIKQPTDRDYNVLTYTDMIKQFNQWLDFLSLFIVAVAAISLFVGGIGVANIMLVSVTERTREIGIRKAVGATRAAVLRQFLSEAVILTALGGLIGIILGVCITETAAVVLPKVQQEVPVPILTASPILIAFVVSLIIGVLAGGYPANRAARLRPIEALRFE